MVRRWIVVFCLIGGVFLIGKGWHWAKGGFSFSRVRTAFPSSLLIQGAVPREIAEALNQPYSYLGQGRQYYVFSSKDGKFVLKLPRLDRYEIPFWLASIRFPFLEKYREKVQAHRKQRLTFLLESAKIAFEELPGQTGILWVHFHETALFHASTKITDRIGRTYPLDLDRTPFVLQQKKESMANAFARSIKKGDLQMSKEILSSLLRLIAFRSERGIYNKDHTPSLQNYGFDGSQAFEIDIGSFYRNTSAALKTPFRDSIEPIQQWVGWIDSGLQSWFGSQMEAVSCDP